MKKKLLKLAIIFFILFEGSNFIYANEKIILPEKKPIISKEQTTKKITNYLMFPHSLLTQLVLNFFC